MTQSYDQDDGAQYGDYQDDDRVGDGLIRLQWRQGDVKQSTPGFFYLSKKDAPEGFVPTGKAWQACKEFFESTNTREDGWKAEALPVAIICARAQPYVRPPQNSQLPKQWLDVWPKNSSDGSIAMHCDVLLVADGLQDLGVVAWSTGGSTTAFAIIGQADPRKDPQGGILHRIREEVLDTADKAAQFAYRKKKKLYWLFWITIAGQRDAKGEIVFTPTKGKTITRPVPMLPVAVDTAWLKANFVGTEMAMFGEEMRRAYDDWRLTKRTNDAQATKANNGRNVPQPITADEFEPF